MVDITVLRLGHRIGRDSRITTHCGLVARSFGASKIIITGDREDNTIESLKKTSSRWGGDFTVEYIKNWKKAIKPYIDTSVIVHLTMYGLNLPTVIDKIKDSIKLKGSMLIVIGSQKVPGEMYDLADFNVAVGNSPHSEVSALALTLDRIFSGKQLEKEFSGANIRVIPQAKGKSTIIPED
ncbi:MAG: tRNA (cytidine(56)-2'-O)-methyltransferase [DPANN group archaeon]|nr:tRNA (cytidine(56)-2'-O)-methyltransferase [DPANN group archaeon]